MYLPLILWSWQRWPVSSGGWSPLARHTPPPAWLRAWLCSPGQTSGHTLKTTLQKRATMLTQTHLWTCFYCRPWAAGNPITSSPSPNTRNQPRFNWSGWLDENSQCIFSWFTKSLPTAWPVVKYNNKRGQMQPAPLSMGRNDQLAQVSKSFFLNAIR